jgi:DNA-binding XRE family transcriptional regulator
MPVYFVRAGDNGPVKIGWARVPEERIAILQSAHYEPLRVLRILDGERKLEKHLHTEFRDLRIRGEWFKFDERMMGDIGLSLPLPASTKVKSGLRPKFSVHGIAKLVGKELQTARKAAGLTQREVAAALKISIPYISDIECGNRGFADRWVPLLPEAMRPALANALARQHEEAIAEIRELAA